MSKKSSVKLKVPERRHYAKSGSPARVLRGMRLSAEMNAVLQKHAVGKFTQFAELGIACLAYLIGLINWSVLEPVIAANLTDAQRRSMASAARTLALNLEINQELENTK